MQILVDFMSVAEFVKSSFDNTFFTVTNKASNMAMPVSLLGPSINRLVTDGNTKLCCRGFILAPF